MAGFKILLVEDNLRWQKILKGDVQDALDKLSYSGDIQTVHTYDEASDLLKENQWHLLITDIGLGNPSESLQKLGIRLVRQAYAQHIPAIAVSGTPHLENRDVRELFKKAGASDFFSKQRFDDDEFIGVVQSILRVSYREIAIERILVLAASAEKESQSHLYREVRDIGEGLQRAQKREQFVLEQRWAIHPTDIRRAMLDIDPHIVHFSGHKTVEEGLVFEDETGESKLISSDALADLFKLFVNKILCVVLNGCYSVEQAEAIAQYIPYVVGVSQEIDNKAAIEFVIGFYDALGAGRSIEFAYKCGCSTLHLIGISEKLFPKLVQNTHIAI
jgi:CheY-like chemotaxis protein